MFCSSTLAQMAKEQEKLDLVYKQTPQRDLVLTFLPPIQKKYDKAKPILERVLSYYEVDSTNLPRQYKKLAQIDLDKIPQ